MDYLVSYIGYLDECLRELSLHSDSLTYDAQHYPTDILPDDLLSSDGSRPSSSSGSSGASARRSSADSNELRRSTSATAMKTPTVAYHSIPPKKDVTSEIADRKRSIHDSSPARQSAPPPAFACVRKRLHGPRPNIAPQGPYPTPPPLTSSSSGYFGSLPQHPKCHEMKKPLGPRAWSGWEAFQNAVDRSGAAVRNRERASAEPGPVAVVWNGVEWIDAPPALARSLAAQCKASGCAPEKILRRQGGAVAVWMNGQYVVSEGSDAIKIRAPVIPKHWLAPDETGSQSTQRDSGNALAEESEQTDESADGLNFRATTPEDAARWRQAAQLRLQRELAKKQETKANERVRFAENPIVVENSGDESTGASDNQSETELYEYAYSEGSSSAIFGEKTVHAPPVIHVQPPTVEGTPEDTPPVMETPPNESKLKAHVIAEGAAGESGSGHILPVQQQSLTVFLAPPSSTASTALQASMSTVPEISEETRMPDHPSSATPQSVPIPIVVMVMPLLASGVAIRTIGLFGVVRGLWHILVHLAYWLYLACRLLLGYRWPSGTPSPVVPQQAIVLPPQAFLSPACGQAPGTSDESILDSHTIIVTCLSLGALGWILREMLLRSSRTAGGIKTS
ncbi:hypothetical protein BC832DRAFT_411217 [Gaertneriomyces semiglobifer]|nr:hypothetical protein BC832DRAFT_411217 [Gaertneriomyces semiglobifer]